MYHNNIFFIVVSYRILKNWISMCHLNLLAHRNALVALFVRGSFFATTPSEGGGVHVRILLTSERAYVEY